MFYTTNCKQCGKIEKSTTLEMTDRGHFCSKICYDKYVKDTIRKMYLNKNNNYNKK